MSSSSTSLLTVTHCLSRVTPGRSSTRARFSPAIRLINDDFPTFGIPTTIIRIGRPDSFFSARRASSSDSSERTVGKKAFNPFPLRESTAIAAIPFFLNHSIHCAVTTGSAVSHLLSRITRFLLPIIEASSGFPELSGIFASRSSTIIST